jgi:transposase
MPSISRIFIKSPAGRWRFNVLGALNAITHDIVTVTNSTYINALSVCDLLHKLAAVHAGELVTIFLDNARYQKCQLVTSLAESLKIELIYLPPYSPNLNLIERLWKFVKKEVLYSKYYDEFSKFKNAISSCLSMASTTHKDDLSTLLSLKFQRIKKSQIITI